MADEPREGLFRKEAVERAARMDQLDESIRVVLPSGWWILGSLALLTMVLGIWSVAGSISIRVRGAGILVRTGGLVAVPSPSAGEVKSVEVREGANVRPGQIVAYIALLAEEAELKRLRDAEAELAEKVDRLTKLGAEGFDLGRRALMEQERSQKAAIARLDRQIPVYETELAEATKLMNKGLVTRESVAETRRILYELQDRRTILESELRRVRADLGLLEKGLEEQRFALKQEQGAMQRKIAQVAADIELRSRVVARSSGRVVEIKVSAGDYVTQGSPVLALEPESAGADPLQCVVFVPVDDGRKIRAGMEALVTPSVVRREETGSIRGSVVAVSPYPATPEAMTLSLRNAALVQRLSAEGPVHEVRIALNRDPGTPSGLEWSNGRGPDEAIQAGTWAEASIVIRRQPPIALVGPFFRKTVGLDE